MERTGNMMKAETEAGEDTAIRHRQDHISFPKTEGAHGTPPFGRRPFVDQLLGRSPTRDYTFKSGTGLILLRCIDLKVTIALATKASPSDL